MKEKGIKESKEDGEEENAEDAEEDGEEEEEFSSMISSFNCQDNEVAGSILREHLCRCNCNTV